MNPVEEMLCQMKTSLEKVDFSKAFMQMQKNHPPEEAFEAKDKQVWEGMRDWKNASLSRRHPVMPANKQLLNKFSPTMSRGTIRNNQFVTGTNAQQSTGLHGRHESRRFSINFDKIVHQHQQVCCALEKNEGRRVSRGFSINFDKIVHQHQQVCCALEKNKELDPEIQHLIDTFWEVDNCPPPLLGKRTLEVKDTRETCADYPRKLRRVYKIEDLFSDPPSSYNPRTEY